MPERIGTTLKVNGEEVRQEVPARLNLADFLRQALALTGTHVGCEHGVCGACTLRVNGRDREVAVEPRSTLLDALRDGCGLTATHAGCEHGVCGACTVLLDGVPVRSCLMLAMQAEGAGEITTLEGVAPAPGELSIIQDAFIEAHGLQCGYCTPGMILTAHALLAGNPAPDRPAIVEAISANICRCTGYGQIVEAVALAAERMRGLNRPQEMK